MNVIIDYGMGNLGSVGNMLNRLGYPSVISGDPKIISRATKLILPGVGAFDTGMHHLTEHGIISVLESLVIDKKVPILGICLGMQLLSKGSEEGKMPGLGWINAQFKKFPMISPSGQKLRIPNIGWNYVRILKDDALTTGLPDDTRFYFVHSYYAELIDHGQAVMDCEYEGFSYVCAYSRDNIYGVQFHPEKSHAFGMGLLRNFMKI